MADQTQVIIVMGVSGCGKTTVGNALSAKLGWPFYDGDDLHPKANIDKMASGIPLNDDDRWPWLDNIRALISESLRTGKSIIIACSALKERYRQRLQQGDNRVKLVHLRGSYDLIWRRMQAREGHYMKEVMLQSQFDALEEPLEAIVVEIDADIDTIIDVIVAESNLG